MLCMLLICMMVFLMSRPLISSIPGSHFYHLWPIHLGFLLSSYLFITLSALTSLP